MSDRHRELVNALNRVVLESAGSLAPAMRRALADDGEVPAALRGFAHTIRSNAHETKDADIAQVVAAGYTEDQVYEMTVSVALGAGMRRLTGGERALAESLAEMPETPAPSVAPPSPPAGGPLDGEPWTPTPAVDPSAPPLARRVPDGEADGDTGAGSGLAGTVTR